MRLVWTLGGWKISDLVSIHVRGIWSLEHEPTITEETAEGIEVVSEGHTRLWIRMWPF